MPRPRRCATAQFRNLLRIVRAPYRGAPVDCVAGFAGAAGVRGMGSCSNMCTGSLRTPYLAFNMVRLSLPSSMVAKRSTSMSVVSVNDSGHSCRTQVISCGVVNISVVSNKGEISTVGPFLQLPIA